MQNLPTPYNATDPKDPYYSLDFAEFITEDFIEPLQKIGFHYRGCLTIPPDHAQQNDYMGLHILRFIKGKKSLQSHFDKYWDQLEKDSESHTTTYSQAGDTLHILLHFTT